jgi:hypothetical protein
MSLNQYDPTMPGQFNDWVRTTRQTGDAGVGRNTTHMLSIGTPSTDFGGWTSSSPASSSLTSSNFSTTPTYVGGDSYSASRYSLGDSSGDSSGESGWSLVGGVIFWLVIGAILL